VLFYHRGADVQGVFLTMVTVIGTVMVSYTKARAQSIGLSCEIGLMERPERLIVLIAGATFNLLTPAMIVLAVLTNLTALQRILYTRAAPAPAPAPVVAPIAAAAPVRAPAEPDATRLRPSA
jgi:CDP-diacylglycerol--glycerol-3-phosphate 3-phosphatidyltransferase